MAITDPVDTLAYHSSRVLMQHRDMSEAPTPKVAASISKFLDEDKASGTDPESEALWFYGMNHLVSLISADRAPLEPLDEWELKIVTTYHEQMAQKAVRAFTYLMLITTREARHNLSLDKDYPKLKAQFGQQAADFFTKIKGGEGSIHQKLLSNPPLCDVGTYVEAVRWQFYNSNWNSGYGGKAWGMVTDCLARFVKGEFSAEMMLDTIWTLSHNNGPIFNKGICYGMYSHNLLRILDIQRSGQVPEAILTDKAISHYVAPALHKLMKEAKERYGSRIGDYVNWFKVEALGAVQKYPSEKQAQVKHNGVPPEVQAELDAAMKAKLEFEQNHFQVMPNLYVKKVHMARAA